MDSVFPSLRLQAVVAKRQEFSGTRLKDVTRRSETSSYKRNTGFPSSDIANVLQLLRVSLSLGF